MRPSIPVHSFDESIAFARGDAKLNAHLIKFFTTDKLLRASHTKFIEATCNVINAVIQEARQSYVETPERLVAVISASEEANALAVWGAPAHDWIVISEGLLNLYRDAANDISERLVASFPVLNNTTLGRNLQAQGPMVGGLRTALGSFLYVAAICYFTGHEAGHHLAGHDGYYVNGAHAEAIEDPNAVAAYPAIIQQALELHADRVGLGLFKIVCTKLLTELWDVRYYSDVEKREFQTVLAILLLTGAMMTVVKIKPRKIDWKEVSGRTHPPATVRIVYLAIELSESIRRGFNYLDDSVLRHLRIKCLEIAAGATIDPGSSEAIIYQERLARGGEPAAIRALGIRKALMDPEFQTYIERLSKSLEEIRDKLKPRTKASIAL